MNTNNELKNETIKEQFKKAIDQITGKEHFYHCRYWTDFRINGRQWKVENEGHFIVNYYAEIEGTAYCAKMSIKISASTYNGIRDYFEKKMLSLNFANN